MVVSDESNNSFHMTISLVAELPPNKFEFSNPDGFSGWHVNESSPSWLFLQSTKTTPVSPAPIITVCPKGVTSASLPSDNLHSMGTIADELPEFSNVIVT